MTTARDTAGPPRPARTADDTDAPHRPVAVRPVVAVAAGVLATLLAFAGRYDYHADELYFRLLGERGPAWGYVDQPPLLPTLVHASRWLFGDTPWGVRLPAAICAAVIVVVCATIAAELGGGRRAQLLTAFCVGTSTLVLTFGHWVLTSSVDTAATCVVLLCATRALLRGDGRYWLVAGAVVGLALHAKFMVLLLPVCLLLGLLLVGPRSAFRDRRLYLGVGLALLIGAPNLVYQVLNDFPQLQMARALGELDGADNRAMFATNLLLQLGPLLTAVWLFGLYRLLSDRTWRPVRAIGVGYLVATAAALYIEGGRPDYTGGFLIALLIAGCVALDRWVGDRRLRQAPVALGLVLTTAFQVYLGLPVLPESSLARWQLASMQLESVGWQPLVDQVAQVYRQLPDAERDRAVVLAENFGQAGALDLYGEGRVPAVYSGHNELHAWGPPPESADVVISLGVDEELLRDDFVRCEVVARIDNGLAVENPEQGRVVSVCRGRTEPWSRSWPGYRHLGAYL
ncbi:ArnT family glycosyltransferase [Umezawaea beigongshangensis]|uniref:ArnT family glycosyltransferase n=1 Tax=Umezawaea beigongshangensis TaxID=2780383 RepID=UPI0018F1D327|nr:glycosyltransferase family 39 protein [Umezawaea beigongshangensis]